MTDVLHGISDGTLPNISHITQGTVNRSSIDLSLELERQLDSESFPPDSHDIPGQSRSNNGDKRTSLDPQVLAHIVMQLRTSLGHVSQERDDLVQQLAESHSREAEFKDSLALLTERCASLEKDLEIQRKKSQGDEEAIVMLRSKVEESRRGLMRLQSERNAENKRMTIDLTHARTPSFAGPRSSQRASFAPLTGSGQHAPSSFRRTSSTTVAENDPGYAEFVAGLPGSVGGQTLLFNDSAEPAAVLNRRRSMFGYRSSNSLDGRSSPSNAELESLRQELAAARAELEDTRHELSESNEAREASETCVKALRDFIVQSGGGDLNLQLPPLPSDLRVKDVEPETKPKSTGWGGLKLWRVDTSTSTSSSASASSITPVSRKSIDSRRTINSEHDSASPSTAVPLRNKFGAFFARGTSISSIPHLPPAHPDQQTPTGSDASSTEEQLEPISPPAETAASVLVQEPLTEVAETGRTPDTFHHEPGDSDTLKVTSP